MFIGRGHFPWEVLHRRGAPFKDLQTHLPRPSTAMAAEALSGSPSARGASGATAECATQPPQPFKEVRVRGRVLNAPQETVGLDGSIRTGDHRLAAMAKKKE